MFHISKSRAFRYFIACYILLLICVELPIAGVILKVRQMNLDNAVTMSKLELDTAGTELDCMIATAAENTTQMGRNTNLKKVAYISDALSGENAFNSYMAMTDLNQLKPMTYSFDGQFIYFASADIVLTPDSVYYSAERFCNLWLKKADVSGFKKLFEGTKVKNRLVNFDDRLCIINEITFQYPNMKKAYSCFFITANHVKKAMNDNPYAILDMQNEIIISSLSTDDQQKLSAILTDEETFFTEMDGEDVLISKRNAQSSCAVYVNMRLLSSVQEITWPITRIILISFVVVTFVSIGVGIWLSIKNMVLIRGFVREVEPTPEENPHDEFDVLKTGIRSLRSQNTTYQDQVGKLKTSLAAAFFSRLFTGGFSSEIELTDAMDEVGVTLTGSVYTVALIDKEGSDISESAAMSTVFSENVYVNPVNETLCSALFMGKNADDLERLIGEFKAQIFGNARFYTGSPCESTAEIYKSYQSAYKKYEKVRDANGPDTIREPDEVEMRIRRYIMKNFTDADLSLTQIADEFGMSESYLSSYFKKYNGRTISSYIEKLRIDRAYQLITNTEMTIQEISDKSGYQNDRTFRRAFKKVMGCPPGEFRKKDDEDDTLTDNEHSDSV